MRLKYILILFILFSGLGNLVAQSANQPAIKCPGGVMVNSYNGNMHLERNDLYISGRKFSLDMTFYYNSLSQSQDIGFGRGWSFKTFMKVAKDSNGVFVYRSEGRKDFFKSDSTNVNNFISPAGISDSLVEYQTGMYKLITKHKTIYYFEDSLHKRMTKIEEPNGNSMSFTFTDSMLTTITDASGRSLQLSYVTGRLATITDALGTPTRVINYSYDQYGNLTRVTDPVGNFREYKYLVNGPISAVIDRNGNTVNIIYYPNFTVEQVISCNTDQRFSYNKSLRTTHLVEMVDGENQISIYHFDIRGNVLKKKGNCCGYDVSYKYDSNNNLTQKIDANGNKFEYTYDLTGNMVSLKDPLGGLVYYTYEPMFNNVSSYTSKGGHKTTYLYDNIGNLIQVNYPLGISNLFAYSSIGDLISKTDGNGNVIVYIYDNYGNLTSIHKPLGVSVMMTYDARSRGTSIINPNGNPTTYQYDLLDRLVSITNSIGLAETYTYDANENLLTITNRKNKVTSYGYDAMNRRISITNALNHSLNYTYDAKNNLRSFTDEKQYTIHYEYDNMNRLTNTINAMNENVEHSYDGNGNEISTHYPNGNILNKTYDALNRITQISDNIGVIATYIYDNMSNLIGKSNANGNSKSYIYDALKRRLSMEDQMGKLTEYSYDMNSNLLTVKDRNNNIKSVTYNELNRIISYENPIGGIESFTYDNAGNIISVADAANNITTYLYNTENRNVLLTYPDGSFIAHTFDNNNLPISRTTNTGNTINYIYDDIDRIVLIDYPGGEDCAYSYDERGLLLSADNDDASVLFQYDANRRIISESLNGKTTQYLYSNSDLERNFIYPSGRSIKYLYDVRNRQIGIEENNMLITAFDYDNSNLMVNKSFPLADISFSYEYNSNRKLVGLHSTPAGIINEKYVYDNEDNIKTIEKTPLLSTSSQFVYDNAYRLINHKKGILSSNNIQNPVLEIDYTYDVNGNRISSTKQNVFTNYLVNNMNAYIQSFGEDTANYFYDGNGNITSVNQSSYAYDSRGRIKEVNTGVVTTYKYDALGRRIQKSINGNVINYCYSMLNEIESFDSNNNLNKSHIYSVGIDNLISSKIGIMNFYFNNSRLGSINEAFNNSGKIVERYEYDAFGNVEFYDSLNIQLTESSIDNDILYMGSKLDFESGKYFMRARNYDYKTGRFMQRDPLKFMDGLNLYVFAHNNAPNRRDPMGTFAQGEQCIEPESDPSLNSPDQQTPAPEMSNRAGNPDLDSSGDVDRIKEFYEKALQEMVNDGQRLRGSGNFMGTVNNIASNVLDNQGCVGQARILAQKMNERKTGLGDDWTFSPQNGDKERAFLFQHNNVCAKPSDPSLPTLQLDSWNNTITVLPDGECNGKAGSRLDDKLSELLFGEGDGYNPGFYIDSE